MAVPALGGPAVLCRGNSDSLCYGCRDRRIDVQIAPAADGQTYTMTEAAALLGVPRKRLEYLVISTRQLRARKAGERGEWEIAEADLRALSEKAEAS